MIAVYKDQERRPRLSRVRPWLVLAAVILTMATLASVITGLLGQHNLERIVSNIIALTAASLGIQAAKIGRYPRLRMVFVILLLVLLATFIIRFM